MATPQKTATLFSGCVLFAAGVLWLVPTGTRIAGAPCPPGGPCLPLGIEQRTGIFGQMLDVANVGVGVGIAVIGATLLALALSARSSRPTR